MVDEPHPLDGIQVVECATRVSGPLLGKLFVDAGADVIKAEPPGGDALRRYASTVSVPDGRDGALFRYLNGGKRSIVGSVGDTRVRSLLSGSDLLIDDGDPALDVAALRRSFPHLVVVSITAFGRSGPWSGRPATDLTIQAESGGLQFRGPTDRPPVQAGGRISEFLGGLFSAAPALAAVLHARSGGEGTYLDVSVHDVMALSGTNHLDLVHQLTGAPVVGPPVRTLDTPGIERARDGLVAFNCNAGHMMQMFLLLIGQPDLMEDPQYLSLNARLAMGATWQAEIDAWVSSHTVQEVIEDAAALRIPVAPCHDGASVLCDEQLGARDVFVTGDDGHVALRPPYRLNGRALPSPGGAPRLGEHETEVRPRPAAERSVAPPGTDPARPLTGLRVVDLTAWWVGALTTQILGRLGADVVHIEGPANPDGMRLLGKVLARSDDWWEYGHMFVAVDTDRRGIALDLGTDEGLDLLWRLIEQADVLVENFAPRVAEAWGLTHDAVLERNPHIVYLRMPAFGLDGPWRDRPAFAQTIEPMSTMSSITGFADGLPVSKGGLPDPVGGATGAWAAMVGLAQRARSGASVAVESVMLEAALHVSAQPVLEHSMYGTTMGRTGNRAAHAAPQGVYRAASDGEWLAVSVTTDAQWDALAAHLGESALIHDPRFASHAGRVEHHDSLDTVIGAWVATRDASAAADELCALGVPAGWCRDPRLLRHHPQYRARGLFEPVDHPVLGSIEVPGQPYRAPGVDRWVTRPAPTFGQHTREILGELGITSDAIDDLFRRGVVADRPRDL
ncbi:MAG: CoA transferase [Actinobacteria bacterium]|nr:CoA transferase [Actinomycetota bacterium]